MGMLHNLQWHVQGHSLLRLSLLSLMTCTGKKPTLPLPISVYTTVSSAPALAMTSPLQN